MKGNYQAAFSAAGAAYSYVAPYFSRVNRTSGVQEYLDGGFGLAGGSNTVTINKKKKRQQFDTMMHFSRMRGRYGRYRKRTLGARVKNLEEKVIDRWSGVSRFGVGGGFYRICKMTDGGTNTMLPFHIMDLSYMKNNTVGAPNFTGHRQWYVNAAGELESATFNSYDESGNLQIPGVWIDERGEAAANVPSVFHRWTQIKLNLYGSLNRPMKYKVFLFKCDADACPGYSAATDAELKLNVESIIRPYVYSNLLGNCGEQRKAWRVLKEWNFNIDPQAKSDATDANQTNFNPNFKEVKLFVRHNMNINYEWYDNPTNAELVDDKPKTDYFQRTKAEKNAHAFPNARLFLGIVASSGTVYAGTTGHNWSDSPAEDTEYLKNYGSYDLVVRRCFSYTDV